jgi:lipopolysaccharide export system protein LptC
VNGRLYDRLAALVSLVLLGGLGLFTFYLAELADRQQAPPATRKLTHDPDYFVERLALIKMNDRGEPSFRLEAAQLRHFPDEDTTEFVAPRVVSLDPGKPRVVVVADRGEATSGAEETHLHGNVVITRAATGDSPELRVDTDYALVLNDQDIVRTDRPVRITHGPNLLTGVGMELNNAVSQLRVDSQVRGVWAAAPAATGKQGTAAGKKDPAGPARSGQP